MKARSLGMDDELRRRIVFTKRFFAPLLQLNAKDALSVEDLLFSV